MRLENLQTDMKATGRHVFTYAQKTVAEKERDVLLIERRSLAR